MRPPNQPRGRAGRGGSCPAAAPPPHTRWATSFFNAAAAAAAAADAGKFYTLTTGANERRWSKMKDRLSTVVRSFNLIN
jgi:hypothetical protein